MQELQQILAEVQETVGGVSPGKPVVGVKIFDEIDAVVLEAGRIKAIEALDHVSTMMASVVDDEIERAELIHDSREEFAVSLTANPDVNPIGGCVEPCALRLDIDADQGGVRMMKITLPKAQRCALKDSDLEDTHRCVLAGTEDRLVRFKVVGPFMALWHSPP